VEFRILGPLQVLDGERELPLGSPKERELLAVLLLHAGAVVSRERLIDELWGESPPPTAAKALNVHVSQLRKTLARNGNDPVATRPPGYALAVEPEAVDAVRFERLVAEARRRAAAGEIESAGRVLREALALWRGPALDGVELEAAARNEVRRLEELRLAAQMDRIDCELTLGFHEQLIGELEALVAEHPLRERLRGQLMLALYRSGRQADALRCYREAREMLVGELGIEPSVPLQRLERAVLNHDPSLEAPAGVARAARAPPLRGDARRAVRRSWVHDWRAVAGALLAVLLVTLVAVFVLARERAPSRLAPDMLGLLDSGSGRVVAETPARERPTAIAGGHRAVWLAAQSGSVSRIDLARLGAIDTIAVDGHPGALAVSGEDAWVVDQASGTVALVNGEARRVVQRIPVGNGPGAIAAGAGALWVTNTIDGTVTRIDPIRARAVRTITVGVEPAALAVGRGSVWVSDAATNTVIRVDARTTSVIASIAVGADPGAIAVAPGGVWVANTVDGTVSRIDPNRNAVTKTFSVGATADALAVVDGSVWAVSFSSGTLVRIDATTDEIVRRVELGSPVGSLAAAGDRIVVATLAAPAEGHGGTLTMAGDDGHPVTVDPATWWSQTGSIILSATNDGLVTYRRATGAAGLRIVPDLARSLPLVGGGGTRYTFQLRPGLRYSTGRPVRASDVRASIERLWRLGSPAVTYTGLPRLGLVGESACSTRPRTCDLSRAIVTEDRSGTVTFRLGQPNPLFLRLLALPWYHVLPKGTPARDGRPLPATGPYRIARYVPGRRLVLMRNRHFRVWSQAAQPEGFPDRIVWRLDTTQARALADVVAGRADYFVTGAPLRGLLGLETHHASQLHSEPVPWIRYVFLNTRVPPFDSLDTRRALNLAVDRAHIARLLGGPLRARPSCQVLPPGFPGYRPTCQYTLQPNASGSWTAPNLDAARAFVRRSGTLATPIVVWADSRPEIRAVGRYLVGLLRTLGYRARLETLRGVTRYYQYVADSRNRVQLGTSLWIPDVPAAPAAFFNLLSCSSFRASSRENNNLSGFCDPRVDALMRRAASLEATDPAAAWQLWATVDRRVTAQAPWIPLINVRWVTVISERLRNYVPHPVLGDFLISQARVT
jgi:ABC-type transport system substrate-binding protein/DNA-binding SARP family transcriptional activator/DNA-binding beta-propeller fold protein YncE